MAKIGSLTADLKLESAAFIRDMRKASQETARATSSMQRSMASLQRSATAAGNSFKGFVTGFVSVAAIRSLVSLSRTAIDAADAIGDTAAALGVSAEALQRYRAAGEQADVEIGQMDAALKLFQKTLASGKIQDPTFEAFIQRIREAPTHIQKVAIAQEGLKKQFQIGILLAQQSAEVFERNFHGAFVVSQQAIDAADALSKDWIKIQDAISKGFTEGFLSEFIDQTGTSQERLEQMNEVAIRLGGSLATAFQAGTTGAEFLINRTNEWIALGQRITEHPFNFTIPIPEWMGGPGSTPPVTTGGTAGASVGAQASAAATVDLTKGIKDYEKATKAAAAAQKELESSWASGTEVIKEEMTPSVEALTETLQSMGNMVASSFAQAIVEGENLNDVLDEILKNLAKMAINAVLQQLISGAIGSPAVGGTGGGILGSLFHGGGVVGKSGPMRNVPASLFANAPRLHNGLMPDEFPAILQRGERVTPRGGGGVNITIIDRNDSDVKVRSSENEGGGFDIELMIDQVAARKASQPGSALHRTLGQMGVRPAGVRR